MEGLLEFQNHSDNKRLTLPCGDGAIFEYSVALPFNTTRLESPDLTEFLGVVFWLVACTVRKIVGMSAA